MGFLTGIFGVAKAVFNFVAALFGFIEHQELIKAGVEKQRVADLTETVKEAEDEKVVESEVHRMSDDELDRRLRDGGASSG